MLPSVGGLLAGLVAAGFGAGWVLLAVVIRGIPPVPERGPSRVRRAATALRSPALSGRLAGGVLVGVLALVLTHWIVAAAGIAALVFCWPVLFGGARVEQAQIVRLEALVMWTESLRDTIVGARASLELAIPLTAQAATPALRPALTRLRGLLAVRVPLDLALLSLSAELNDASADKVIGSLVLNVRQRGDGLGAVLSGLAISARQELDQRRRISAGRASMRRSVQLVVLITIVFAVGLVVFSRAYVAPYSTVGGQLALAVVVGLFATSFVWMRRLAGGEPAAPFLSRPQSRLGDEDLRVVAHLTGLTPAQAEGLVVYRHEDDARSSRGAR